MHYTKKFDDEFDRLPFYQRYPEFRPFVGRNFGNAYPKILLLAESHYLPPESTCHLDAEGWYNNSSINLTDKERRWINTRGILNTGKNQQWKKKGHTIYRHIEKALIEAGVPISENSFGYVSFMNTFQRPAVNKNTLRVRPVDIEESLSAVKHVIDVLKPNYTCFVSTKAWNNIGKNLDFHTDKTPHAASAWWHRESKRGTGKHQFVSLIKKYIT